MIDLHSHILPNIDDGSLTLEESIAILKKASRNGVTDIVATPHFIHGSDYSANNKIKKNKFNLLKKRLQNENLNINIYLGNEVFVSEIMFDLLKNKNITTINDTRYLLFELPMNNSYNGIHELIFQLRNFGYRPIIAHPERYLIFKENPSLISKYIEEGVLFQSNIGSFFGRYGKEAQKLAVLLLRHHAIHFISSDTHHKKDEFYEELNGLKQELKKYIDNKEIDDLLINNPKNVIEDNDLEVWDFIPFKKNIFGKWK